MHLPRRLGLGAERRHNAESDSDHEPDQPHAHLGGGWWGV